MGEAAEGGRQGARLRGELRGHAGDAAQARGGGLADARDAAETTAAAAGQQPALLALCVGIVGSVVVYWLAGVYAAALASPPAVSAITRP